MFAKNERYWGLALAFLVLVLSLIVYVIMFYMQGGFVVLHFLGIDFARPIIESSPDPFYPDFLLRIGAPLPNAEILNLSWYIFWAFCLPYIPALLVIVLAVLLAKRDSNE